MFSRPQQLGTHLVRHRPSRGAERLHHLVHLGVGGRLRLTRPALGRVLAVQVDPVVNAVCRRVLIQVSVEIEDVARRLVAVFRDGPAGLAKDGGLKGLPIGRSALRVYSPVVGCRPEAFWTA